MRARTRREINNTMEGSVYRLVYRSMLTIGAYCLLTAPLAAQNGLPRSKATADISTLVKCNMTTATNNDGTAVLPGSCTDLYTGATVATKPMDTHHVEATKVVKQPIRVCLPIAGQRALYPYQNKDSDRFHIYSLGNGSGLP